MILHGTARVTGDRLCIVGAAAGFRRPAQTIGRVSGDSRFSRLLPVNDQTVVVRRMLRLIQLVKITHKRWSRSNPRW